MALAAIVGISIVAVAFMAVFFVGICRDGSRIKICEVLRVATEPQSGTTLSESADTFATPDSHRDLKVLLINARKNPLGTAQRPASRKRA